MLIDTIKKILSRILSVFRAPSPVPEEHVVDNRSLPEIHAEQDAIKRAKFFPGGQADLSKCCMIHILRGKINELYFLNHFGTWTVIFEGADRQNEVCGRCGKKGHKKEACEKKSKMFKEETIRGIIEGGRFVTQYITPKIRHRNETEWKDAPKYAYLIDMQKAS